MRRSWHTKLHRQVVSLHGMRDIVPKRSKTMERDLRVGVGFTVYGGVKVKGPGSDWLLGKHYRM